MAEITIKGVEGNPLNINVVMNEILHHLSDGVMETETVDFYPDTTKPVRAYLDSVTARRQYCPSVAVSGNTVYLSANNVTAGVYTLTIICTDTNGKARRFKSEPCIEIYDITRAAEVAEEFDSEQYTINGVFYTFMTQADWAEENPVSPAYIWHKPDLTEYATKEDIETIEGEIPVIPEWAQQPQKPSYTAGEVGAVPTSRTVNGKALSEDITLNAQDVGAQTPIADLAQIREGAAKGATAYQKPSTGIAKSDLTNGIQQSLDRADTALQAAALTPLQNQIDTINNKIPTDATSTNELADKNYVERLVNEKQDTINDLDAIRRGAAKGATAYQLPSNGMPKTDLAVGVQQSLDKANTAYQKPSSGIPKTDLAQEIQQRLDIPIDDEPIAGSSNLVKSGGVYYDLNKLDVKINGINISQNDDSGIAKSIWKDENGKIVMSSSSAGMHAVGPIFVEEGDAIEFNANITSWASVAFAFFCDNNGNIIETVAKQGVDNTFKGIVPSGSTRLYINYLDMYNVLVKGITEVVSTNEENISYIYNDLYEKTYTQADVVSVNNERWKNNNGVIGTGSSGTLQRAEKIDVSDSAYIQISANDGGVGGNIVFITDKNDTILSSYDRNNLPPSKITLPDNAAFVYISYYTEFSCILSGTLSIIEKNIDDLKKADDTYFAKKSIVQDYQLPLDADSFLIGNISGTTGEYMYNVRTVISTRVKYRIDGGSKITYHTENNYRLAIACYSDSSFITKYEWLMGDSSITLPLSVMYIIICIANPSGQTGTPSLEDSGLTITLDRKLVSTEAAPLMVKETLPIYAPSPQMPANDSDDSDFNAETLTPTQLNDAFTTLFSTIPKLEANYDRPKFAGVCSKVGRDASDTYDIFAYQFGKRNRYAWKNADCLYAWKNGNNIVYTDSISPRIGDTIYTSSSRESGEETVASFDSANQQFTSSSSVVYTRSSDDNIGNDVLWSKVLQSLTTPSNIELFDKNNGFIGNASATDITHLTLSNKTYTRCEELDYHTDQKLTILLWGNEHGPQSDPAEPAIILYRLTKDLCEGCRNNHFISFLKNYCKVIIIPCANPYGLKNHTRNNFNNVNINRNYCTTGWGAQADTDKGSYAGDQNETQYIMNMVGYFSPDVAIDIHCLGYVTQNNVGKVHYEGYIPNTSMNNNVYNVMDSLSMWYTNYGNAEPDTNARGGDWLYSIGVTGGLIEMNAGSFAESGGDGRQHTAYIMLVDYTLLLNTLRMWISGVLPTLDLSNYAIL